MMIFMRLNSSSQYLDLFAALLLSALIASASFHAGTVKGADDHDEDFEYDDGPRGPANWGHLRPEWRMCSDGQSQSPVAIEKQDLVPDVDSELEFHYKSGNATLKIKRHYVQIEWTEDVGGVNWNKTRYKLLSLHFHIPCEHLINGVRYPFEVHLVHEDSHERLLVVAILYKCGKEDTVLAKLMDEFPYLHGSGQKDHHVGNASVSDMKLGGQFYHYMGSLTTPPCTENVTWIIMKEVRSVSPEQVHEFLIAEWGNNARPLKPLNGRSIYKSCDSSQTIDLKMPNSENLIDLKFNRH